MLGTFASVAMLLAMAAGPSKKRAKVATVPLESCPLCACARTIAAADGCYDNAQHSLVGGPGAATIVKQLDALKQASTGRRA